MLSDSIKTRIRTQLGIPVAGISAPGGMLGWRYSQEIGLVEFRLLNLQPHEEAQITGLPIATVAVNGNPNIGDLVEISVTLNGTITNISYTVQSSDIAPNANNVQTSLTNIATKLANLVTGSNLGLNGAFAPAPTNNNYPYAIAPNAQVIIYQTVHTPLSVSVSFTGSTNLAVIEQGNFIGPQITFNDENPPLTAYGYLAICEYLQSKMAQTSDNLSLNQADVMKFRVDEMTARKALWMNWRKQLAQFLGCSLFPTKIYHGTNTGFVV